MKIHGWEMSAKRDEKTGQLVSTVNMPKFPGLEKILETAQKMYEFVNNPAKGNHLQLSLPKMPVCGHFLFDYKS